MPSMYTVSCGVYVDVGSVKESDKYNGYSHFIEHLMFKGTKNRNYFQISECMDDIGAQLNAFTAKDNTCYYTKSGSEYIEKCLDLLSDLYFNSLFDPSEIDKEKSVILEEISTNDDIAEDVCQDLIAKAIYFDSKLGQTILGKPDNIKYSDRHSILDFRSQHYTASNTVITIAGNFQPEVIEQLVEELFESKFAGTSTSVDIEPTAQATSKHLHCFKDVEQSHFALAYPIVSLSSDQLQQYNLMSNILGGGMSSRLFQTIREQHGLAYSVYSYPSLYKNNGFLEIYCASSPSNIKKVAGLYENILADFVKNGVTQKELDRAKAQSINGMYMSFENSLNVMIAYGRRMLKQNKLLDIEEGVAKVQKVTVDDVNNAIKQTFAQSHASCYVGKKIDNYDILQKISI